MARDVKTLENGDVVLVRPNLESPLDAVDLRIMTPTGEDKGVTFLSKEDARWLITRLQTWITETQE